jgi:hypothetical protein
MVYFVDGYNDALFRTTLDGPADSLPTALVKGCYSASSLTIPHGQSYVYMACNGYRKHKLAKIIRANLDGSDVKIVLSEVDHIGLVTAMAATDNYIFFTTRSGCLKSIDLAGANFQSLAEGLDNPTDMVITARPYEIDAVIYVSTPHDILRISMDGKDSKKIISGMWNCRGLSLYLSHGKMLWADHGTNSIFMADLDGQNIDSVVTATSPFAVEYYTDTGSLSAIPTHSPTADPSPFPSLSYDPTSEPTAIPTMPPTPLPSYYWSRLYFTAGTTTGGSFLYMSRPDGGQGDEEPIHTCTWRATGTESTNLQKL